MSVGARHVTDSSEHCALRLEKSSHWDQLCADLRSRGTTWGSIPLAVWPWASYLTSLFSPLWQWHSVVTRTEFVSTGSTWTHSVWLNCMCSAIIIYDYCCFVVMTMTWVVGPWQFYWIMGKSFFIWTGWIYGLQSTWGSSMEEYGLWGHTGLC